jgi:hypothetical protein
MRLEGLFDRYGSDKANNGHAHRYHEDYERLVPRDTQKLVELGLGSHIGFDGSWGSPKAWLEWLDGGEYVGFDIVEPPKDLLKRMTFVKGDCGSREDLERLAEAIGECDVIIDDASHIAEHQRLAFEVLWPCVRPGGYYIVEDLYIHGSAVEMRDSNHCIDVVGKGLAAVLKKPEATGASSNQLRRGR